MAVLGLPFKRSAIGYSADIMSVFVDRWLLIVGRLKFKLCLKERPTANRQPPTIFLSLFPQKALLSQPNYLF
jgi:hypothetical protein